MLDVGAPAPSALVWLSPSEHAELSQLGAGGAYLLLFYLFDWSST
jgi:hypothetical protein